MLSILNSLTEYFHMTNEALPMYAKLLFKFVILFKGFLDLIVYYQ
jgi:hypothetical protein